MKKNILIKILPLLTFLFFYSSVVQGQYIVNFEGTGETKTAYASGNVTLSGKSWNMTEALIGTIASDWKNGLRSARMKGISASALTMLENKSNGIGTISFKYRRYGTDTQVDWKVEYSTNNGTNWTQIGNSFTAPASDVVQTFSEIVNVSGNIRIRIKRATESGSVDRRLNIDDITITDYVEAIPTLTVTSPNGGESWEQGSTHNITWTSSDFTGDIKIELDNGSLPLQTLVENIDVADGTWSWPIDAGQAVGANYKIKISDQVDSDPSDLSNAVFSIIAPPLPTLTVTSPNGGESWEQGSTHAITWTSANFSGNIKIELESGAKASEILAENISSALGTWSWPIPAGQALGAGYKIKISDQADGEPSDLSNAVFSIIAPLVPVLTVTSPNGGESWMQGSTKNITWTTENFSGNIKIELESGAKATETLIENLSAALGTWSWPIPAGQALGSDYKIKISDQADGNPFDYSNATFSIVALPALVINEIMYNSSGNDNEWFELYNNGTSIIDLEGYYILDNSDASTKVYFPAGSSIAPGDFFTVSLQVLNPPLSFTPDYEVNPQPSWQLNNNGSDAVRIFSPTGILVDIVTYFDTSPWPIAPDGSGPSLSLLLPGLDNNVASSWAASRQNGGTPGAENFPPVVTVTSPNGGELWEQGSTHNITWTSLDFTGNIKIELDNGADALQTLIENIDVTTGTWSWTIDPAQTLGTTYKIKISDQADGSPSDFSNAVFSITAPPVPVITVTSPNGGEEWEQGSTHAITWTTENFSGNVKIELLSGAKASETLIENVSAALGTWSWAIPAGQALGTDYKVKISDQTDGDPSDQSNVSFSIIAPPLPVITVTSPNGGENWEQGSTHAITWTTENFTGDVKIELLSGAKASETLIENVSAALGTWSWNIPAGQALGTDYKVKISDQADGDPTDQSNAVFSITAPPPPVITVTSPNGGESWLRGTSQAITWTSENFAGNIKIELSDGAKTLIELTSNIPVATGTWTWNIPVGQTAGTNYTIIVSGMTTGDPSDESNAPFTIETLPALVINEINYNNPGDDNEWFELYNNGSTAVNLEGYYIQDNNNLSAKVTFPAGYSIAPGQYFTVSLELLAPPLSFTPNFVGNPTPTWSLGNTSDAVRIFHPAGLIVDIVSYQDNSPWPTAPDGSGPTLSLKNPSLDNSLGASWAASRQNGGTPGAENFPPVVTITSPNGGESWEQGSSHNITWTSLDFTGNIKIELDNGADALQTLIENIDVTTGTWSWTIDPAQTLGTTYKIKISDQADGSPSDFSNAVFSITAPPVPVITVTSPNGGENWEQGSTHAITWTTENFSGNVKIELLSGAKASETLIENVSAALGTWSWNIPAGQALGTDYQVKISDQADDDPSDQSNVSFSIIAPPLPVITVTSPNGGEEWEQGSTHAITWTTENFSGNVKIELLSGAKASETLIENISAALGTWSWNIPAGQALGTDYKVKVSDQADGDPTDQSNAVFSITAPPAPVISVTSPTGGEAWMQGSTHNITWTSENFSGNIKIELESGTKASEILVENISSELGTWSWTISAGQVAGSDYKIKISDQADGDPFDFSDASFSILALPSLVINEIMYNSIEANDNEWIELYNAGSESVDLTGFVVKDNDNSHSVTVPSGYAVAAGDYFTIAIKINTPPLFFTPDWNANAGWGLDNNGDQVRIFHPTGGLVDIVSYDDNAPWPVTPDGTGPSLSLLNPSLDNNEGANWEASRQTNGTPGAENFPPVITVTSPNGGESWMQGEIHNITWTSSDFSGNIKIELLSDAKSPEVLAENVPVAGGSWSWTIPDFQTVGSDYKIKISDQADGNPMDESDATFTIVAMPRLFVTSPNGGESWMQGEVHNITWTSSDFSGNIKIELLSDTKAADILAENIPVAGGSWSWTIPDFQTVGSDYKIKISDQADGNPMDESDAAFTIVAMPRLFVTSPNGGELWELGSIHPITWSSSDFAGNISIELLSGTKTSEVLAENIPVADGSWSWTIPEDQPIGDDYKIRISDHDDGSPADESNAVFAIFDPVVLPLIVITEIMYNPPVSGAGSFEFIELYNNDEIPVNLEGWQFSKGIGFTFPNYVLQAGDYVVIAANAGVLAATFGVPALQWTIGDLSNDGEEIELKNADDDVIDYVVYDNEGEWPITADGAGPSLSLCNPGSDNTLANNWKASVELAKIINNGTGVYCTPGAGCGSKDYLSVYYPQGWVGISGNVIPDKIVLNQLFAPALNNLVIMLNESGIFWPAYNFNTIGNWNYKKGYKAKFSSKTYFVFEGTAPEDKVLNLGVGNYYIPVLSPDVVEVSDVIVPLGAAVDFLMDIYSGQIYWPAGGITPGSSGASLNYLVPGYSYYVKILSPVTIDFGSKSSGEISYKPFVKPENATSWNDVVNTGVQHLLSVSGNALKNLQPGDVIGVFSQSGICTGMSRYEGMETALPLLAFGDDMTTSELDGLLEDELMEFRIFRQGEVLYALSVFDPSFEDHDGLFTSDGLSVISELKFGAAGIENQPETFSVFPNPGNGVFNMSTNQNIDLAMIYSTTGSLLLSREISGNSFTIDVSHLGRGLYYVKLRDKNSGIFYSEKIIIQ